MLKIIYEYAAVLSKLFSLRQSFHNKSRTSIGTSVVRAAIPVRSSYSCSLFGVQMKYPHEAIIEMIKFSETFIAYIYCLGID